MSYNEEMQSRNAALQKILAAILALPSDAVRYGLVQELTAAEITQVWANIGLKGLTLGYGADGLLYIFAGGVAVGNGIELPTGGIDGYITEDKQIVFNNLPDGEWTLAYVAEDGSIAPIGTMEKDSNTYYSVTNTLTRCTSNNSATRSVAGESYAATITANTGYELESVVVTMGGVDISSTAVSGGNINIASVTGNIVITAVASETQTADPTNWFDIAGDGFTAGGRWSDSAGAVIADGGPDCLMSNNIPVRSGDIVYITNADVYSGGIYSVLRDADMAAISRFNSTGSDDIVANDTTSGQMQFTVANANVGYVQFCLKPADALKMPGYSAAATALVTDNYDCAKIAVTIKRNGEWL